MTQGAPAVQAAQSTPGNDGADAPVKAAPKKKGLSQMNGVVVNCLQETHDTWSLDISVGDDEMEYIAGQFISIDPKQFPELVTYVRYDG